MKLNFLLFVAICSLNYCVQGSADKVTKTSKKYARAHAVAVLIKQEVKEGGLACAEKSPTEKARLKATLKFAAAKKVKESVLPEGVARSSGLSAAERARQAVRDMGF